ncbi:protein Shroom1 [Carlito syrichta]|uniref:Protein Shroom1 n=1 Tax=Carlito syrichta TaxID=1868482 RepID=A0A1U7T509_CARSF|nr:protein Shroom1 [Carlito syrichta]
MEALGPRGDRASPASSTGSLDLRRLSLRADSAYSSFSAASGGPEPRTPSPGADRLPYLDWDYVRVHLALAEFEGHQPPPPPRGTADLDFWPLKLGDAYGPAGPSLGASGEDLGPWGDSGGTVPIVQAFPQGEETPRPVFQTKPSRFLTQKEAAVMCSAEVPQSSPVDCEQKISETCIVSAQLPSLPDEVFLEEIPLVRIRSLPDSHAPQELPTSVYASDHHYRTGLGQRAGHSTIPLEYPIHENPRTAGPDNGWQGANGSVGVSRPTNCSSPGTSNGDILTINPTGLLTISAPEAVESDLLRPLSADSLRLSGNDTPVSPHHATLAWDTSQPGFRPAWPSQHFEDLVQELARLDPSISDTLASHLNPEPPLGLLDGLIPLDEVWAAMRPACGETGEKAAGTSGPGFYQCSATQLPPTSQEETRLENPATHPEPDQPCGQGLLAPNNIIQAKKVELAGLLQMMLRDLHASVLQRLGLLQRQREDAKELREHVARRERALREVLARALPAEELRAYCALLAGKAAMLAQQRCLDERVRLLQDQLDAVRSDLGHYPLYPRLARPPGTCPPDKPPFPPPLTQL